MTSAPATGEARELLDFAVELAEAAGRITLRYYGHRIASDAKGDGSPVTVADREAEAMLRERIGARYPAHGILGEEYGEANPGARVRWILDPIDATRSFMRGVPLFGVLIGVEVDGAATVGVAHFPALGETVAAATGLGCTWNGAPCRVSGPTRLEDALVLTTDPVMLQTVGKDRGWDDLERRAGLVRTWGDCYGHALVATGRAEVMVDPIMSVWDCAPFLPILREAGGRFTDRDGVEHIHGGSAVSTNGPLHDEVLALLRGGGQA